MHSTPRDRVLHQVRVAATRTGPRSGPGPSSPNKLDKHTKQVRSPAAGPSSGAGLLDTPIQFLHSLADAAGISKRMVCYLQNGDRAPSVTVAYRILDALNVDPATGWGAEFIAAAIPDVGKDR